MAGKGRLTPGCVKSIWGAMLASWPGCAVANSCEHEHAPLRTRQLSCQQMSLAPQRTWGQASIYTTP